MPSPEFDPDRLRDLIARLQAGDRAAENELVKTWNS